MVKFDCENCGFIGKMKTFGKPCPKCKGNIIAHFNTEETEIIKILVNRNDMVK